jgi:hypothetical protein
MIQPRLRATLLEARPKTLKQTDEGLLVPYSYQDSFEQDAKAEHLGPCLLACRLLAQQGSLEKHQTMWREGDYIASFFPPTLSSDRIHQTTDVAMYTEIAQGLKVLMGLVLPRYKIHQMNEYQEYDVKTPALLESSHQHLQSK